MVLDCELPKKSDNEKKSDTDINLVRCDKEYTVEHVTNADMGIGSGSPITRRNARRVVCDDDSSSIADCKRGGCLEIAVDESNEAATD